MSRGMVGNGMPHNHKGTKDTKDHKVLLFCRHCERSEAIQNLTIITILDCRVALLLAMTKMEIAKTLKIRYT